MTARKEKPVDRKKVAPADPAPNKVPGRPSVYTDAVAEIICTRIAGGEGLERICEDELLPSARTVRNWLATDGHPFLPKYERARDQQADLYAEQIIEIADTCVIGEKITTKADGSREVVTGDMVERSRLQIDARKWIAAKLKPKKYGDKQQVEHSGGVTLTQLLSEVESGNNQ